MVLFIVYAKYIKKGQSMSNNEQTIIIPDNEIQIVGGSAKVTSLDVAKRFNKLHKNVLRAIEQLDIISEFKRLNFEPCKYLNKKGQEQPMFLLTKDGFVLLAMGFTGKSAMQFKIAYIDLFNRMEAYIRATHPENTTPLYDWGKARIEGKVTRKNLTDVIRDYLIPYAISLGSKNAGKFYINYTKLSNLYIQTDGAKIPPNLRDCLSAADLLFFRKTEEAMAKMIQKEIEKETPYKEIYLKCKEKIMQMIDFYGKSTPLLPVEHKQPKIALIPKE